DLFAVPHMQREQVLGDAGSDVDGCDHQRAEIIAFAGLVDANPSNRFSTSGRPPGIFGTWFLFYHGRAPYHISFWKRNICRRLQSALLERADDPLYWRGWRRMGPWRSGVACSRVYGAATAKRREHVWVMRRQDPHKRATGFAVARRQYP